MLGQWAVGEEALGEVDITVAGPATLALAEVTLSVVYEADVVVGVPEITLELQTCLSL